MVDIWINKGKSFYTRINIEKAEEHYNAKYLFDISQRDGLGNWTDIPLQLYYVEKPTNPEHPHYFALRVDSTFDAPYRVMISDGSSVVGIAIEGVKIIKTGEIIFSRFSHDFRKAETANVNVDGGLSYLRVVGDPSEYVKVVLTIIDGELVVVEDPTEIESLFKNKLAKSSRPKP